MKLNTTPLCVQNTALHPFGLLLCIYLKHTKTSLECSRCVRSTIVQSNSAWLVSLQSSKFVLWKWPLQHSLTVLGCYKKHCLALTLLLLHRLLFLQRTGVFLTRNKRTMTCTVSLALPSQPRLNHAIEFQCTCTEDFSVRVDRGTSQQDVESIEQALECGKHRDRFCDWLRSKAFRVSGCALLQLWPTTYSLQLSSLIHPALSSLLTIPEGRTAVTLTHCSHHRNGKRRVVCIADALVVNITLSKKIPKHRHRGVFLKVLPRLASNYAFSSVVTSPTLLCEFWQRGK